MGREPRLVAAAADGFYGSFRLACAIVMAVLSAVTAFVTHQPDSNKKQSPTHDSQLLES